MSDVAHVREAARRAPRGAYNALLLTFTCSTEAFRMTMKKTDLEKNKALKLAHDLKNAAPDRFGKAAAHPALDRRAQRRLDQGGDLVASACELNADLVAQLIERAA